MVDRFFLPEGFARGESRVELDRDESVHGVESKRMRVGFPVELLDGNGFVAIGKVTTASRRGLTVAIESSQTMLRAGRPVELALSLPRGGRMETLVDIATQLGVERIVPVVMERSVATREEVSAAKKYRWIRIAREACKQSGNAFLPDFAELIRLEEWLYTNPFGTLVILHPGQGTKPLATLARETTGPMTIIIGPEGGITDHELALLQQTKCKAASLGNSILRIEAAAIVAAGIVRNSDL